MAATKSTLEKTIAASGNKERTDMEKAKMDSFLAFLESKGVHPSMVEIRKINSAIKKDDRFANGIEDGVAHAKLRGVFLSERGKTKGVGDRLCACP